MTHEYLKDIHCLPSEQEFAPCTRCGKSEGDSAHEIVPLERLCLHKFVPVKVFIGGMVNPREDSIMVCQYCLKTYYWKSNKWWPLVVSVQELQELDNT